MRNIPVGSTVHNVELGDIRSANADMSNDKGGEKPPRRKTKGSCPTLIGAASVPKYLYKYDGASVPSVHPHEHDCAYLTVLEVARVMKSLLPEEGSRIGLVAVHLEADRPVLFGFYDRNESRC